jgi:ClpP class serine protease
VKRRTIRFGELLAIQPDHVHAAPNPSGSMKAMWWDYWAPTPQNERVGENADIAVVQIDGALDYRKGYGGCSYEDVVERVTKAFTGDDVLEQAQRAARYGDIDEEEVPAEATPPKAVVLRIDSPGGAVSGLNQTVFTLRRLAKEAGIPFVAYVDEMATSAAYALACSCDEILIPPSGICGSIGVISMMVDATEADKKMGLRVAVITSGARKADGHPHAPMTSAAVTIEQKRVDRFAKQFYRLVAEVRPLSVDEIQAKQAGIFVGVEGVKAGLADAVMGWDKLVQTLDDRSSEQDPIDKPGTRGSGSNTATGTRGAKLERPMGLLALKALVTSTKSKLAKEKDPKRKKLLAGALAAAEATLAEFKKVKHTKETHEEESSDEDEDEEESGNETDREESGGDDDDDDEGDDDDDKDEDDDDGDTASAESDEESKKTAKVANTVYRALATATGTKGKNLVGAVKALVEKAEKFDALSADVAGLKKTQLAATKNALIDEAVAQRRITRGQAKNLRSSKLSFVKGFLAMHKSPLVNIDEEAALAPDNSPDADVPAAAKKMVEQAIVAQGLDGEKAVAFRKQAYDDHRKRMSQTNGAGVY